MYKVKIEFMDGSKEEFYSDETYGVEYSELRLVSWILENGDKVSYPVDNIRKLTEIEVGE